MRKAIFFILVFFIKSFLFAQSTQTTSVPQSQPKLVVGIVVDQMRYDFIYRYWNKYGEGGFRRLVNEGIFYRNAEYNYVPTYTGPGHACIFTGATPSASGIVSNDWYDRSLGKEIYCVSDASVNTVGANNKNGQMSPKNLLVTTITDELKLSDNFQSKVIGVSLKDRAAILPAGHLADGAYWFDNKSGNFITSTFYMQSLPQWVQDFNARGEAQKFLSQQWNTLLPLTSYTESLPDDNIYEGKYPGETKPVFPHNLPLILDSNKHNLDLIRTTPFGNSFTKDFAEAAIRGENLGKHSYTDFLTINFASTDYVGHQFGPRSIETEDTYLRMDQDLADLLAFLDLWVGKQNVIVFLTGDHGVADVPQYNIDHHLPGGYFNGDSVIHQLKNRLQTMYGDTLILNYDNQQIYLNTDFIKTNKLDELKIEDQMRDFLLQQNGVADAISIVNLKKQSNFSFIYQDLANGIYPSRSGDMTILLQSGWMEYDHTGTTHGAPYDYDTHVPVLIWGGQLQHLISDSPVTITEIAPTICQLLNIQFPSASTNQVLPGTGK
jgi:predicted AlkP superfamily pyrophosphatase or phosphodiesterase